MIEPASWQPQQPAVPQKLRPGIDDMHWAVRGGIADLKHEFAQLRPHMARRFPFELDVFQKEAVLHLEKVTTVLPPRLAVPRS